MNTLGTNFNQIDHCSGKYFMTEAPLRGLSPHNFFKKQDEDDKEFLVLQNVGAAVNMQVLIEFPYLTAAF